MTDLVSQLVAQLEDMRGKVIELCQTYGNALPHGSLERTDAALTAAKAGGWVAVPVEPTVDMLVAAHDAEHCGTHEPHFANAYRAMLAARPTTPPEGESVTTTQPAALPELPEPDYVHEDGHDEYGYATYGRAYTADQMRARDAMWAERLAALQPKPAAAVSDERQLLREIVENYDESLQALGDELRQRGVTQISYYGPQAEVVAKATQLIDRARATLALRPQAESDEAQIADYQEALASVDALVRRLDVAINGSDAAPQARLCDIVSQVEREGLRPQPAAAVSDGALDEILRAAVAQAIFFKEGVQTVERLRNQLRTLVRRTSQVHLLAERESHMIEAGRLQAEIRRLQSLRPQAVPMTDDAERLDWMATNEAHIGWNREGEVCRVWVVQDEEKGAEPLTAWHSSARAAIDEARGITAQGAQGEQA